MKPRFLFEFPKSFQEKKILGLALLILTLFSEAAFLTKAAHIDDNIYLFPAHKFYDLSKYYEGPYYLFGERHETLIRATHPPLVPFINFLIFQFSPQFNEVIFHLVYLSFTLGAIGFTYLFGLRFCRQPVLATILLLFSPGFFVVTQNLMTDIILYVFLIGSITLFIYAVDQGGRRSLMGAIILFALAIGTGFQAMVFFASFFIYSWVKNRSRISYSFLMGLALIPTLLWYAYQFSVIDQIPDPIQMDILDETGRRAKIIYFFSNLSLAFVAPLGLFLACVTRKQIPSGILSIVLSYTLFETVGDSLFQGYSTLQKGALFCGGTVSIWVLLGSLKVFFKPRWNQILQNPDNVFLCTTIWIYLAVSVLFTPFAAGRYLIPVMIFIYVLILREAEILRSGWVFATIFSCVLLSFLSAWADFRLAAFYKDLVAHREQLEVDPEKTWYVGEWGFRFYMEKTEYKYLAKDSTPQPGDWIIDPAIPAKWDINSADYPVRLKKDLFFNDAIKFKVFNRESQAGFWSQGWGLLPFWSSHHPLERVRLYQVLPEPAPLASLKVPYEFKFPQGISPQAKREGSSTDTILRIKPGEQLELFATLTTPSRLEFRIRFDDTKVSEKGLFYLLARMDNRERTLISRYFSTESGQLPSPWQSLVVDLTSFQGRPLNLVFKSVKDPETPGLSLDLTAINLVEVGEFKFKKIP